MKKSINRSLSTELHITENEVHYVYLLWHQKILGISWNLTWVPISKELILLNLIEKLYTEKPSIPISKKEWKVLCGNGTAMQLQDTITVGNFSHIVKRLSFLGNRIQGKELKFY